MRVIETFVCGVYIRYHVKRTDECNNHRVMTSSNCMTRRRRQICSCFCPPRRSVCVILADQDLVSRCVGRPSTADSRWSDRRAERTAAGGGGCWSRCSIHRSCCRINCVSNNACAGAIAFVRSSIILLLFRHLPSPRHLAARRFRLHLAVLASCLTMPRRPSVQLKTRRVCAFASAAGHAAAKESAWGTGNDSASVQIDPCSMQARTVITDQWLVSRGVVAVERRSRGQLHTLNLITHLLPSENFIPVGKFS